MTAAAWKLNIMPVSNCCSAVIRYLIAFYPRAGPADPAGGAARGAGLPPDWGGVGRLRGGSGHRGQGGHLPGQHEEVGADTCHDQY